MDIRAALREARVEFRIDRNDSAEITICCLFCPERGESIDTRFRLGINIQKDLVHCWNCGYARKTGGLKEIARRLKLGDVDAAFFGEVAQEQEAVVHVLPNDFERIRANGKGYWHKHALKYLLDRGVTIEQIEDKQVGYSLLEKYGYRIIFPLYFGDELQGFVARAFVDREPRYLNTPGIRALFNFPFKSPAEELNLCEGIFKCLKLERFFQRVKKKFPFETKRDCVALLGHSMTEVQETMIQQAGYQEVVLWGDPDRVGAKGFIEIADSLSLRVKVTIPWPILKKQVDETSFDEIENAYTGRLEYNERLVLQWQQEIAKRRR